MFVLYLMLINSVDQFYFRTPVPRSDDVCKKLCLILITTFGLYKFCCLYYCTVIIFAIPVD